MSKRAKQYGLTDDEHSRLSDIRLSFSRVEQTLPSQGICDIVYREHVGSTSAMKCNVVNNDRTTQTAGLNCLL